MTTYTETNGVKDYKHVGAITEQVGDITIRVKCDNLPLDVYNKFKETLKSLLDKGKPKTFKVIEIDTIAGFSFRHVTKARFINITTMHLGRLLKR